MGRSNRGRGGEERGKGKEGRRVRKSFWLTRGDMEGITLQRVFGTLGALHEMGLGPQVSSPWFSPSLLSLPSLPLFLTPGRCPRCP